MASKLLFSLVLAHLVLVVLCAKGPCSNLKIPSVKGQWDLSGLAGTKYSLQELWQGQPYDFDFMVCNAMKCANSDKVAVCQTWQGPWGDAETNCGLWNPESIKTQTLPTALGNKGISIVYAGGETGRSTVIHVICDSKAKVPTGIKIVNYNPSSGVLEISMKSKYGCPKGGLSPGSIMLIVLTVLLAVYLIGGFIFLKFVRKAETLRDSIPNYTMWAGFFGLVKEGAVFIVNKIRGGPTDYQQV